MSALIAALLLLLTPMTVRVASAATADEDFDARCHGAPKTGLAPSADGIVLRCFGFDTTQQIPSTAGGPGTQRNYGFDFGVGTASGTPAIDTTTKASGAGSMMMRNFVGGGSDSFGSWFTHFGVNKTHQLNTGDDMWIQFRVRWSPEMLVVANWPNGAGFKVKDISFGDLPTCDSGHPDSVNCPTSCPNQGAEWVTQQVQAGNIPLQNYANCGGNVAFKGMYGPNNMVQNGTGCLYPAYPEPPCVKPKANEWFTFKYHIKMGTFNSFSTTLQMWIAREGQPSVLVVDCSPTAAVKCVQPDVGGAVNGWWLENQGGSQYHIGKIWLHPYMSNMSGSRASGAAWYDELIISTQNIPDPGRPSPGVAPSAPCCLSLTEVGPVSLVVFGVALLVRRRWRRHAPPRASA